ncbi:MAG: hypothetical protein K9M99_10280 [Candidatus Cloacimonetes bacterium]|nr:hypothetical protein [Candidatus Cloacimonadota bacterium]
MSSPREIVTSALRFTFPARLPRDLWLLPVAAHLYPETVKYLQEKYPNDFTSPDYFYPPSAQALGNPYKKKGFIAMNGAANS